MSDRWFHAGAAMLLMTALVLGGALLWHRSQARALGSFTQSLSGASCLHPILYVSPEQLVMSRNDTRAVLVYLTNRGKTACKFSVRLEAPHFMPSSDTKGVSLAAGEQRNVSWLLSPPDKPGDFQIKLSAARDEAIVGIRVTSVLGMSARQAELLMFATAGLGASGITIPWLCSVLFKRRRSRTAERSPE
jgi:hypothetical protein